MAIIINDYEPSGDVVEVQLPGTDRFTIPTSEVLTLADFSAFSAGDFTPLYRIFPESAHEALGRLHLKQVSEFVEGWIGSQKDSES